MLAIQPRVNVIDTGILDYLAQSILDWKCYPIDGDIWPAECAGISLLALCHCHSTRNHYIATLPHCHTAIYSPILPPHYHTAAHYHHYHTTTTLPPYYHHTTTTLPPH